LAHFAVRLYHANNIDEVKKAVAEVGASPAGVWHMAGKGRFFLLRVEGLTITQAAIIKQSMLSVGGEAALHKDFITHNVDRTDALIMGTRCQLERFLSGLAGQQFNLPVLASEITAVLDALERKSWNLPLADGSFLELKAHAPLVMGILNLTPDSFSDGGSYPDLASAQAAAWLMAKSGAGIIDVGGESTNPHVLPVSAAEEKQRVMPLLKALQNSGFPCPLSIDTYKAEVAEEAYHAGVSILNFVSGYRPLAAMAEVAARYKLPLIITHAFKRRSEVEIMSQVVADLRRMIAEAVSCGVKEEQIIIDPGLGFHKEAVENWRLLSRLDELAVLGRPILVAASRKRLVRTVTGGDPADIIWGDAAICAWSVAKGAALLRVHDVAAMRTVVNMASAIAGER